MKISGDLGWVAMQMLKHIQENRHLSWVKCECTTETGLGPLRRTLVAWTMNWVVELNMN